jgi:hypothetical protein
MDAYRPMELIRIVFVEMQHRECITQIALDPVLESVVSIFVTGSAVRLFQR